MSSAAAGDAKPFLCPFERCLCSYTRKNKLSDHLIKRKSFPDELHIPTDPIWQSPATTALLTSHTRPKNLTEEERAARRKASQLRCWRKNKEVYQLNKRRAQEEVKSKLKVIQELADMYTQNVAGRGIAGVRELFACPPKVEEWIGESVGDDTFARLVAYYLPYEQWPQPAGDQGLLHLFDLMPGLGHKNDLAVQFHETLSEELLGLLHSAWDLWSGVMEEERLRSCELFTPETELQFRGISPQHDRLATLYYLWRGISDAAREQLIPRKLSLGELQRTYVEQQLWQELQAVNVARKRTRDGSEEQLPESPEFQQIVEQLSMALESQARQSSQ
jgi:hypothetical protein